MYLKVENEETLIRDSETKAILNTDRSALKRHDMRKVLVDREKRRDAEINSLRQDITEIKDLIKQFLSR